MMFLLFFGILIQSCIPKNAILNYQELYLTEPGLPLTRHILVCGMRIGERGLTYLDIYTTMIRLFFILTIYMSKKWANTLRMIEEEEAEKEQKKEEKKEA